MKCPNYYTEIRILNHTKGRTFWCVGTQASFSAMLTKGDRFRDFLFAYLKDEVNPKWDLLLKERMCFDESIYLWCIITTVTVNCLVNWIIDASVLHDPVI